MKDENKFLRDGKMTIDYFNDSIRWLEEVAIRRNIEYVENGEIAGEKYKAKFMYYIFTVKSEVLFSMYSRGDALPEIKKFLSEVVNMWEWSHTEEMKVFDFEEMKKRKKFSTNLDFYLVCLWLVSLALCLEVDDALFERIVKLCGNEGEDGLFEILLASRIKGRKPAVGLSYPEKYQILKSTIYADSKEECGRLMKIFLEKWYSSLSKAYWHDSHKDVEEGGYFGYWCFEAAGIVKAYNLDDTAFRDMPYYPKDLIF